MSSNLPPLDNLDKKAKDNFPRKIVRKTYATSMHEFKQFPVHVKEFLISKYADEDGSVPPDAIREIFDELKKNTPEKKDKEVIKSRIKELGTVELIGQYEVFTDLRHGNYYTNINAINEKALVNSELINPRRFPDLLRGGLWGKARFQYIPQGDTAHINMDEFEPYQSLRVILKRFIDNRKNFSTDEWIDFILRSIGYNPNAITSRKLKLLYLTRLIPLVESCSNSIELGPPSTGKSFLFENISEYCRMVLGGEVSLAKLIYHSTTRENGLVFKKDLLCFDEINKGHRNFRDLIPKLQQIMASNRVERGDLDAITDVSLIFQGNYEKEDKTISSNENDYLSILPSDMNDTAFLDRVHIYIHGWQFRRYSEDHLNKNLGLINNYFGEVLHKSRARDVSDLIEKTVEFHKIVKDDYKTSISLRDKSALLHTLGGYIKLIYPDKHLEKEEWKEIIDLAIELRENVIKEMVKLDNSLNRKLGYDFREDIIPTKPLKDKTIEDISVEEETEIETEDRDEYLLDFSSIYINKDEYLTRKIPYYLLKTLIDIEFLSVKNNQYKIDTNKIGKKNLKTVDEEPIRSTDSEIEKRSNYSEEEDGLKVIKTNLNELSQIVEKYKTYQSNLGIIERKSSKLAQLDEIDELIENLVENKGKLPKITINTRRKLAFYIDNEIEKITKGSSLSPDLFTNNYAPILKDYKTIAKLIEDKTVLWKNAYSLFISLFQDIFKKLLHFIKQHEQEEHKAKKRFGGAQFPLFAIDTNNLFYCLRTKFPHMYRTMDSPVARIYNKYLQNTPYLAYFFVSKHLGKLKQDTPQNEYIKWYIETKRKEGSLNQYADVDVALTNCISPLLEKYKNQISHFYLGSADKDFHTLITRAQNHNIPVTVIISDVSTISSDIIDQVNGNIDIIY